MPCFPRCARRPALVGALLASCFALEACGKDDTSGPTTLGSYTLAASPGSLFILPGDTNAVRIDIARSEGFAGAVTLNVSEVPAGVSASVTAGAGASDFAVLRVTTIASMPQGVVTLKVNGTAAGQPATSVSIAFTVGPAPSLQLSAPAVRMLQGGNGETLITAVRSAGLIGNVTYGVSGVPAGLDISIAPVVASSSTATLALTSSRSVAPGLITLTVTGVVDGRGVGTARIPVEILPFTGGTGNVAVDFRNCPAASKPVWFAYQNGDGAWSETLPASDVYRFNVTGSKGGYAYALSGSPTHVSTRFLTLAELNAPENEIVCPTFPAGGISKTVRGTFADLSTSGRTNVSLGGASLSVWDYGDAATDFQLFNVPAGPQDLVAYHQDASGSPLNDRVIVRRDVDVAHNGQLSAIDFAGPEALVPATATMTVRGALVTAASRGASMGYRTGANCVLHELTYADAGLGTESTIRGIPTARQRPNDFHSLTVWEDGETSWRWATHNFHTLANQLFDLPPMLTPPVVTIIPGPYPRLQAALTLPVEYNHGVSFAYGSLSVAASRAWLGGAAATLTPPDFTGVTGMRLSSFVLSGAPTIWTVSATGESGVGANGACTEGSRSIEAGVKGRT